MKNTISAATDGAPAMTEYQKGFISYLKNKIHDVLAVHCVHTLQCMHRQHLVARNISERLFQSLQHIIRAVNKIRNKSLISFMLIMMKISTD